jgi:hypothetical protein
MSWRRSKVTLAKTIETYVEDEYSDISCDHCGISIKHGFHIAGSKYDVCHDCMNKLRAKLNNEDTEVSLTRNEAKSLKALLTTGYWIAEFQKESEASSSDASNVITKMLSGFSRPITTTRMLSGFATRKRAKSPDKPKFEETVKSEKKNSELPIKSRQKEASPELCTLMLRGFSETPQEEEEEAHPFMFPTKE